MKILIISLCLLPLSVYAATEKHHQDKWCAERNGVTEYRVKAGRVDCLTQTHAIEFGFANKWKEDIAQSRWYALQTGKRAGMVMIMKKPSDIKYVGYVNDYLSGYGICIQIWTLNDY